MPNSARMPWADDDAIRRALELARRLPAVGRKPAEYLLAYALLELHERLEEALAGDQLAGVADEPDAA